MTARISFTALAIVLTALAAQLAWASDGDRRITLTGPGGQGSARFRDHGNERRLRVEVEKLRLPINTVLDVTVDGKVAGSMKITGGGAARLELRARGKDTVPLIAAGSTLLVFGPDGAVLMRGKF